MLSRRGSGCLITIVRTAAFGATPLLDPASGKDGCPCFADLHHQDLRPGEPPEGQLDRSPSCALPLAGQMVEGYRRP